MIRRLKLTAAWAIAAVAALAPAPEHAVAQVLAGDARNNARCDSLCLPGTRTVSFETSQGTRMSVSLSPDGRTILFDLLGDIYTVPISGGQATRVTSGMAFDMHPVFSPDGKQIAFVSDRSGSDNLWVIDADGKNARAITKDRGSSGILTPEWSPDGQYILVSKSGPHLYHKDGGAGTSLSKTLGGSGFMWSPDGRYVFSGGNGGPPSAGAAGATQIKRLDRVTGEATTITSAPNGGMRPVISPDGRWLVYAADIDAKSGLRIRNLETDDEEWLIFPIDLEESYVRPRYQFTPDGRAVIIAIGGTFTEVNVQTRQAKKINFTAKVEQQLGPFLHHEFRLTNDPVSVRAMRYASQNPAGTQLVFNAVNKIWSMDLPNGTPREIASQTVGQFHPVYSPDGSSVAYVTWDEVTGGHVWKVSARGGTPQQLTTRAGYYVHPAWSADGSKIAFIQDVGTGSSRTDGVIQWVPSTGGKATTVTAAAPENRLTFAPDGNTILFVANRELASVRIDGFERRVLAKFSPSDGAEVDEVIPSPDGKYVAFSVREDLYLAELPPASEPPTITDRGGPGPFRQVSKEGGIDVRWTYGGRALTWLFANKFYRADRAQIMATASGTIPRADVTTISLNAPRHYAKGTVVLRNARIVTMRGTDVIERGDVVVTDNRIVAVGRSGEVTAPSDARVIDVTGKTIIPGLIDMHAHYMYFQDIFPKSFWQLYANLAYGVTTTRDPSSSNYEFPVAELIEAGVVPGPRLFAAGRAMTTSNAKIESLDDARAMVRHYKQLGGTFLKQYMQPTRRQRHWIAQAAAEEGLNITAESWTMAHHYTMVIDGYTGVEHQVKDIQNHYDDIVQFRAKSRTWYTPTLMSGAGGIRRGGAYHYQFANPHDDEKLARFTPHDALDGRTRMLRTAGHLGEYTFLKNGAVGTVPMIKAGGNVTAGGHGEQQGIGLHWEMWMMQMAGLTNHEALRTGTILGAEGLGMAKDLGSIEVGKLADLLVLDSNPLDNIKNTNTIRFVMKNGELFQGDDLKMIWPREKSINLTRFKEFGAPPKN